MNNQKEIWDLSFQKKDNYLFYPHEEVIRFVAKYFAKRVGLKKVEKFNREFTPRVLDLGCGIGRHIVFTHNMEMEAYGIDLSENAISFARNWAKEEGIVHVDKRIVQGDITKMPFENNFFDCIISHGVLDSMSIENSMKSFKDASRVLTQNGYFYCDLVSGDDSAHSSGYFGEEIVQTEHELNTTQLYFNRELIEKTVSPYFNIQEMILIKREDIELKNFTSRYHLVLTKK